MAYNPNIPQPNDIIRVSQADILANFQAIPTLWDVDHYLPGAAHAGKHKHLTMLKSLIEPATNAGDVNLYTKNGNKSNLTELFLKRGYNQTSINLTEGLATLDQTENGYAYIGGSLIKWGLALSDVDNSKAGTHIVLFPAAANIPKFKTTPLIFTSMRNDINADIVFLRFPPFGLNTTNGGFIIQKKATANPIAVRFFAIGT